MKWGVMLYVAGHVFTEIVIAQNEVEARGVAQARNPFSTVLSCNAKFD